MFSLLKNFLYKLNKRKMRKNMQQKSPTENPSVLDDRELMQEIHSNHYCGVDDVTAAYIKKALTGNPTYLYVKRDNYIRSCIAYYITLRDVPTNDDNVTSFFHKKAAILLKAAKEAQYEQEDVTFCMDDNLTLHGLRNGHILRDDGTEEPVDVIVMLGTHHIGEEFNGILITIRDQKKKIVARFVTEEFDSNHSWCKSIIGNFGKYVIK